MTGVLRAALIDAYLLPDPSAKDAAEILEKGQRWRHFLPILKEFGNEVAIREFVSWYSSPSGSFDRGCSREKYVLEILDAVIGQFAGTPEFFAWVIATGGKRGSDRWTDAIESMIEEFEAQSGETGKVEA